MRAKLQRLPRAPSLHSLTKKVVTCRHKYKLAMSLFQSSEFTVGWVRINKQMTDARGRGCRGGVPRILAARSPEFRRAGSCGIACSNS